MLREAHVALFSLLKNERLGDLFGQSVRHETYEVIRTEEQAILCMQQRGLNIAVVLSTVCGE